MTRPRLQLRRPTDRERIRRLFVADDAELDRLALIARLELETRLYAPADARS